MKRDDQLGGGAVAREAARAAPAVSVPASGRARGARRLWNGAATASSSAHGEETTLPLPPAGPADPSAGRSGAAVFTRGDRVASGWLGAYAAAGS
ncbi:hypothetical protein ACFVWY_32495 [Streptomyces sp. NPDC058195]|uniref:hypothetical protein n=1 Tax=Streptomyces sp. NPDC058195 TaxID=3346375 RepID=UPI0036E9EAF8